jgi:hypothetical protein
MTDLFLIEQIHIDPMENSLHAALGYSAYAFVTDEKDAAAFCARGKVFTSKDCWAIHGELPEFKYKRLGFLNRK